MINILIVEDDKNILRLMSVRLKQSGYNVFTAENGEIALDILQNNLIDLMIVDIMMPIIDGYELIEILRKQNNQIPAIMVTANQTFAAKKRGFLVGIDDYMVKPINHEELILRIEALLRRAKIANEKKIVIGDVIIDYNTLSITKQDKTIVLPKKEFFILFKLLSYPEQTFTKTQLLEEFWGYFSESDESTIKVHINRLRNRTKDFAEFEIITVHGLGYKGVKYE